MNETRRPTDDEPFEKQRISMAVLGIMLMCGTIGALLWFGRNSLPAVPSLFATSTPTVTATSTPTSTPTVSPTRTPRPTPTVTPLPSWVTEFSGPILAAVANTSPHFEDDFSQESEGWRFDIENSDRCKVKIKDGSFTMSVETDREAAWCSHPAMQFSNFVLRVDIDLRELGSRNSAVIQWRGTGYSTGFHLSLSKDGNWSIHFCVDHCITLAAGRQPISPTQKITVIIISKGREYAIYMDEIPVSYINDIERRPGRIIKLGLEVPSKSPNPMIVYDNLKIWNLDYIPNLP